MREPKNPDRLFEINGPTQEPPAHARPRPLLSPYSVSIIAYLATNTYKRSTEERGARNASSPSKREPKEECPDANTPFEAQKSPLRFAGGRTCPKVQPQSKSHTTTRTLAPIAQEGAIKYAMVRISGLIIPCWILVIQLMPVYLCHRFQEVYTSFVSPVNFDLFNWYLIVLCFQLGEVFFPCLFINIPRMSPPVHHNSIKSLFFPSREILFRHIPI